MSRGNSGGRFSSVWLSKGAVNFPDSCAKAGFYAQTTKLVRRVDQHGQPQLAALNWHRLLKRHSHRQPPVNQLFPGGHPRIVVVLVQPPLVRRPDHAPGRRRLRRQGSRPRHLFQPLGAKSPTSSRGFNHRKVSPNVAEAPRPIYPFCRLLATRWRLCWHRRRYRRPRKRQI